MSGIESATIPMCRFDDDLPGDVGGRERVFIEADIREPLGRVEEDLREMSQNLAGFFGLLSEWTRVASPPREASGEKDPPTSDDHRPGRTRER